MSKPWQESCLPCKLCGSHEEMYGEEVDDWETGLPVIRIGCLCDASMELRFPDDIRTEFLPLDEAIAEWNYLFGLS